MEPPPNTASGSRACWLCNERIDAVSDLTKARMPTDIPLDPTSEMEDIEDFRLRARAWLAENMKRLEPDQWEIPDRDSDGGVQYARDLMARLYDGGFSGICFPREYGGQ